MSLIKRERVGIEVEREELERLAAVDDLATRREGELRDDALAAQQLRALRAEAGTPGLCKNCDERCLPTAVYCDTTCREDHEAREAMEKRRGRRP